MCDLCTPRRLGELPEDTRTTTVEDAADYEQARERRPDIWRDQLWERAELDCIDLSMEEI